MKNIFLVILLACAVSTGCFPGTGPEPNYDVCKFRPGMMVRSKVSQEVGQVITMRFANVDRDWCYYDVRFQGNQEVTDSRILSGDGPITVRPLTVVTMMRPYELEKVKQ